MTLAQDFLSANSKFVGDEDAASISQISDVAWPAVLEALEELNGAGELGIDCSVAITRETLADFESAKQNHWRECRRSERFTFSGLHATKYEGVQLSKGAQRRNMIIVDAGEYRIALS